MGSCSGQAVGVVAVVALLDHIGREGGEPHETKRMYNQDSFLVIHPLDDRHYSILLKTGL